MFSRSSKLSKGELIIEPPIKWWISSSLTAVMEALAESFLTHAKVTLGREKVWVERVYVEPPLHPTASLYLETLSPIVASTGVADGKRIRKIFLSPEDERFSKVITENLQNKARALWGIEVPDGTVTFLPLRYRSRLATVHGTKVKSHEGIFEVKGSPELIKLGYEAGFGERNSQGFGMMKVVSRKLIR